MPGPGLGQISRNSTGQLCISTKVMGVDPKEVSNSVVEAKKAQAQPIQETIDKRTKQISALQEAKDKLEAIQKSTSLLANNFQSLTSEKKVNIYENKQLDVSSNDGSDYTTLAQITPFETANLGGFSLSIQQLASADLLKTIVQSKDLSTALGLSGTLSLGTTFPNTVQNFVITDDMSLADLQNAINLKTSQTHVYAEVAFIAPGVYDLKLKSQTLSAPIVLTDNQTGLQSALGFNRPASNTLAGSLQISAHDTPLNQTGSLVVGIGNGNNTQTLAITANMSLTDIVQAINNATSHTAVTADYDLIYNTPQIADDNGHIPDKVYQLRLKTQNTSDIVYINGSNSLLKALGLSTPITDYNSLASLFTCDGTSFKRNNNTITDVVKGVAIDLKGTSTTTVLTASVSYDKSMVLTTVQNFINAYNDFKKFYDVQIALDNTDPKKPKASETAVLINNTVFKNCYTDLSKIIASAVPGLNKDGNVISALGLSLDSEQGILELKDIQKFTTFLDQNYQGFIRLLGNQATINNPNFKVRNVKSILGSSLSNVPITVNYSKDNAGVETASLTIGGQSIPATVKDGIINGQANASYPGMEGLQIVYIPDLENNQSASATLSVTQGLCARLDRKLTQVIIDQPLLNEKGTLIKEIDTLSEKDATDKGRITKINTQAEQDGNRMYKAMQKANEAEQKYQQIHSMVKSFQKARS